MQQNGLTLPLTYPAEGDIDHITAPTVTKFRLFYPISQTLP